MSAKLLFLGDFCIEGGGGPNLSSELLNMMRTSDVVSVNFEGPIRCNAEPFPKVGPALSQNALVASLLKSWGVNFVCLANNHIMDYGSSGIKHTLNILDDFQVIGAGNTLDEAYSSQIIDIRGISVAMLAFSEAQFGAYTDENYNDNVGGGYAWVGHPLARKAVQTAREEADYVIVQVHAGLEMVEIPLPEWRMCYRELIDLGADLVIGHHPHVIQGHELYNGKDIYYSIGNFFMDRMTNSYGIQGGGVEVDVSDLGVRTTFIPLKIEEGSVLIDMSDNARVQFDRATFILENCNEYRVKIDEVCEQYWELYYSKYYEFSLNGFGLKLSLSSLYRFTKSLIKNFFSTGKTNQSLKTLMLIHNTKIETHRWVVERALLNRSMKK